MTQEEADRLLRAACDFQRASLAARERCREQFRHSERNEDNITRILIDGQIGIIAEKVTVKIETATPAISYQLAACASFIRTHFLISDCILNGDLVEALTLIRKQLESLARLHELDAVPFRKLLGRVPNIQNVLKGAAGHMYGDLSEVVGPNRLK